MLQPVAKTAGPLQENSRNSTATIQRGKESLLDGRLKGYGRAEAGWGNNRVLNAAW